MIKIQKLKQPGKRSGYNLRPGETTEVRGLAITNVKAGVNVYVDKFTTKRKGKTK